MFRRLLVSVVAGLALLSSATAIQSATAKPSTAAAARKLIVAVKKTVAPAATKKLAVLVLVTQNGGAPAGAVATPMRPLTVLLENGGLYRVKAEIDSSCKGSCAASYRIFGSASHKLEVVPSCRLKASGLVCSKLEIVKVY